MNLGRTVLAVFLLLALASCLETASRDESSAETGIGGTPPTPVAKARPTSSEIQSATPKRPSIAAGEGQVIVAAEDAPARASSASGNAGSTRKPDGKTGTEAQASAAPRNTASGVSGEAGSTKKTDGKTGTEVQNSAALRSTASGVGGNAGSTKKPDGKTGTEAQTSAAPRNTASGVSGEAGSTKKPDGKTGAEAQATAAPRNTASGAGGDAGSTKKSDGKTGTEAQTSTAPLNTASGASGDAGSTKKPDGKTGADGQVVSSTRNTSSGTATNSGVTKQQDGTSNKSLAASPTPTPVSKLDAPAQVTAGERDPASAAATDGKGGDDGAPDLPNFVERSLNCDVIEIMGKAIGRRRSQGEKQKSATDAAIDEVIRQTGEERDNRFVFSGRVYGMLIYNLEKDHTADGFGAYAYSACMILRGGKALFIPADKASVARLDQSLKSCESGSLSANVLNACIFKRMEEVVIQRGAVAD